jgi:FkbM family methyltransferase
MEGKEREDHNGYGRQFWNGQPYPRPLTMLTPRAVWRRRAAIYAALDRPGIRWLLARMGTVAARRETSDDVAIVYRGAWFYRIDEAYTPVGRRFVYRHGNKIREAYAQQLAAIGDIWLHSYSPEPGDMIVDVGAGVGAETAIFSAAVGSEGRVLAIEAHPATFAVLAANVRVNRMRNVSLAQYAVADTSRAMYIDDRELDDRNTTSPEWEPGRLRAPVEGLPLDEILRRFSIDRVDFLKMNIEGAESKALEGLDESIERVRHVCIACHDWLARYRDDDRFRTRERVESFLRERGFAVSARDDDPREYVRDHVHGVR